MLSSTLMQASLAIWTCLHRLVHNLTQRQKRYAHVLHCLSKKGLRVTGSVLTAEIIGFVTAFDMASALRNVLEEIYQQSIPLYGRFVLIFFHGHAIQCVAREASLDRDRCCMRGLREVRACKCRVCEDGVQPGRTYDKTCLWETAL
jgi:hypothetical protein